MGNEGTESKPFVRLRPANDNPEEMMETSQARKNPSYGYKVTFRDLKSDLRTLARLAVQFHEAMQKTGEQLSQEQIWELGYLSSQLMRNFVLLCERYNEASVNEIVQVRWWFRPIQRIQNSAV